MYRKVVSTFFLIIFTAFVSGPTIILMVDDTIDVSAFYASSEEEEKGNEKEKDKELLFFETLDSDSNIYSNRETIGLVYFFKKYSKPHLNLILPPPEHSII
ncbi:hypothetical protein L3X37_03035 [Sabulilitoribacter arenilitoris]|uniref:Uncharacterized protein n=1 Tax=Wocania arenilitoris TaxID=2044858 RepID=A0AAE3JNJ9_9FLAO|nr:hypothetical protein [Wocania arenilitoris]MCF7567340.1 hypothetical protein [Wocania arenilitoris]